MMNLCKAIPLGHPCIFCTIPNHQSKAPTNHLIKETKSLTETPLSNTVTPCYMKTKKNLGSSNRRDHIRKVSIEIPVNEGTTSSSLGSLVHLSNHREKTCEPVSPQEPSRIRDSLQVLETVWHGFSISKTWWPSIISLPTNCRRNKETLPEHSIKCVFCFGFGRAYLRYVRVWSLHRKSQPFDRVFSLCPSLPITCPSPWRLYDCGAFKALSRSHLDLPLNHGHLAFRNLRVQPISLLLRLL